MTNLIVGHMNLQKLTPEEERIIKHKGTEAPFSGEYENHYLNGIYACRQCSLPLFDAQAKFDAGCGWPSFDESFPFAVKEVLDTDGERTEIMCARCGGHLGHVFRGEQMTEKDTRHCVNSLSIKFISEDKKTAYQNNPENVLLPKEVVLGGGCFWCVEAALLRVPGVLDAKPGYAGGERDNPTYEQVCNGNTGHAEVVKVIYDAKSLPLPKLLEYFFMIHDPTSLNKQGNDVGTEYRSIIFYENEEEKKQIEEFLKSNQQSYPSPIVTEVRLLEKFYSAEPYHTRFFEKNPYASYCQAIVKPKVDKIVHELEA